MARPTYDWTIMIYMTSNDLHSEQAAPVFLRDLNNVGREMKKHSKSGRVKILLLSYGNWSRRHEKKAYYCRLYDIKAGFLKDDRVTLDIINANMGDGHTLSDFIGRCREFAPAKKYMLFLWGHGTGPGMLAYDFKEDESNIKYMKRFTDAVIKQPDPIDDVWDDNIIERQILHKNSKHPTNVFWFNVSRHPKLKKYLPNETRLDCLTAKEIRRSLSHNFKKSPAKIDIVAIFGCAMQMVEFGYEIRKHCDYYVASEELMWWEGYDYKKTFTRLLRNPAMAPRDLAMFLIRDAPKKPTYSKAEKKEIAISCVDLNQSEMLAEQIGMISHAILAKWVTMKDYVKAARKKCYHLGEESFDSYIDVTWFFKCLSRLIKQRPEHKNIYNMTTALVKFLERDYILTKYIGADRNIGVESSTIGGHGVSIYMPYGKKDDSDNLQRLAFKRDSVYKVRFEKNEWNMLVSRFLRTIKDDEKYDKKL